MPKTYNAMPTKHDWKLDLGLEGTLFGHKKSPFPALERVGKLIDDYHDRPVSGAVLDQHGIWYTFHIHLAARFIVRHHNQADKLGGTLTAGQLDAVTGLEAFTLGKLRSELHLAPATTFEQMSASWFGRDVGEVTALMDTRLLAVNGLDWLTTEAQRAPLKLSFRSGVARRWTRPGSGPKAGNTPPYVYDTDEWGDNCENGGGLFVLDARGRLYTSGQSSAGALHHSSFLGGAAALMAGTMRVEHGRVVWVSGKSGHYKPTVAQMVTLLERLAAFQVDLHRVMVYRENNRRAQTGTPHVRFEGCKAMDLLRRRAWPTGEEPQALYVA
jgi:hypothetical protein